MAMDSVTRTAGGYWQTDGSRERSLTSMPDGFLSTLSLSEIQESLSKNHLGVDDADGQGRTVLMNACRLGRTDVARILLENGADPNKKCKQLNTPLHYACYVEYVHEPSYFRLHGRSTLKNYCEAEDEDLDLVEMLLSYGATLEPNIHGWNPACYAAIIGYRNVLEYLINNQRAAMSGVDKLAALEILVFTLSVLQQDFILAYEYLFRVLNFRFEKGLPLHKNGPSQLEDCLEQRECLVPADVYRIRNLEHIKIQGLLIGDRVLPIIIKDTCLWERLFLTYFSRSKHNFFRICDVILSLEEKGKVPIGTVLVELAKYSLNKNI